jgi:hypothetical protein
MNNIPSRSRMLKPALLCLLPWLLLLLLAACGSNSSGSGSGNHSATMQVSTPTTMMGMTASATLKHTPSGMATLNWDPASHALTVKLSLVGLAPGSEHPAHIHAGSCGQQSRIIYPLQFVAADVHGVAATTTDIPHVANGIPATGWYINVHNGPGLATNDQDLPIVCGNIVNSQAAQSVQVALNSAPNTIVGQSVAGTAQLSLSGGTLVVKLTVSGLEPGSSHAAHIHTGSCASQGGVVYPLQVVVADMWGKATVTTTIPNVPTIPGSGWYVNVHHSTALTTSTGFDPVACGDVVLGQG